MFCTLWNADKNVSLLIYQHIAQYWHKCLISLFYFATLMIQMLLELLYDFKKNVLKNFECEKSFVVQKMLKNKTTKINKIKNGIFKK